MATPNIVNTSSVYGKKATNAVTTSGVTLVANAAASGTTVKVNLLSIANIDADENIPVDIFVNRSSTDYYIAKNVTIPYEATLMVLDKPLYLEEGDTLKAVATADNALVAVCSYEVIA